MDWACRRGDSSRVTILRDKSVITISATWSGRGSTYPEFSGMWLSGAQKSWLRTSRVGAI